MLPQMRPPARKETTRAAAEPHTRTTLVRSSRPGRTPSRMRLAGVSSFSVSFAGFCRTSHSSFSVRCSSVHRFVLAGAFPALLLEEREKTMTITIINKATRREQQQNGPCPYLVDCPPEPRK
jgi:hypothetical protein